MNPFSERSLNLTTLPEYFQSQGYLTLAAGKIMHGARNGGEELDRRMWSRSPFVGNCSGDKDLMVERLESGGHGGLV